MHHRFSNQRGQVAVLFALLFPMFVLLLAFFVNMGLLINQKIRLQNSVDAGVYSANASLAATAPAHVAEDILVEVGLADRMAPLDSPIGRLWVAWNGRGVSEVELADDGPAAVARHATRSGRPHDL